MHGLVHTPCIVVCHACRHVANVWGTGSMVAWPKHGLEHWVLGHTSIDCLHASLSLRYVVWSVPWLAWARSGACHGMGHGMLVVVLGLINDMHDELSKVCQGMGHGMPTARFWSLLEIFSTML